MEMGLILIPNTTFSVILMNVMVPSGHEKLKLIFLGGPWSWCGCGCKVGGSGVGWGGGKAHYHC